MDGKEGGGKTYTSLIAPVLGRMTRVITGLDTACGGASGWVVPLALAEGEILVPHVGVLALGVEGSVDGSTERGGAVVAWDRGRGADFVVGCSKTESVSDNAA